MSEPTPQELPNTTTPEVEAILALDTEAQRVIDEFGRKSLSEDNSDEESNDITLEAFSLTTGDTLSQTTSIDGTVTYKHTTLWHAPPDRGNVDRSWQGGSDQMTSQTYSELHGFSDETICDTTGIGGVKARLETSFPAQKPEATRKGPVRRFLAKVATRNS